MKQSSNKKSREATAFLYERLSRDDNLEGESYSIGNQKKLLTKVAKEKGYTNLVHFLDDGISGVTMNRPGFVEMMQQLEQGKASAVFVKDLSRLGRNYIEVGRLTEEFFPDHDIRLVAVSDNIDTAEGENELAPIRNLFNEWYARDISKKRRISNKIKGNSGEPMGLPPYGYIKDPNNPKHWVIDEEAAQVVRRIFDMTLEGFGTEQIATQFEKEGILTPQAYWIQKGIGRPGRSKIRPATKWNGSTITHLLYQQEYCGDVLNFKTYSKSYKAKPLCRCILPCPGTRRSSTPRTLRRRRRCGRIWTRGGTSPCSTWATFPSTPRPPTWRTFWPRMAMKRAWCPA